MAGERNFLRVPPDSTGKRVRLAHNAQLGFINLSPTTYQWKIEREYLLSDGKFVHLHEVYNSSPTEGILDISFRRDEVNSGYIPAPGITIKDPDTEVVLATIGATTEVYVNATNIVGFNNPSKGLEIDATGSANIRFAEGIPQLDSFGKLRVSGATLLGDYVFTNSYLPDKFSTNMSHTGASIDWDSNKRAALLSTDTTSGSLVAHTSNTYHHYFPGSSHLFMCTLALGDSGKAGLGRSWGLFDFQNGFHFVHREYPLGSGQIKLGVVVKSDVTGSTVDQYIWQEDWNGDKLDGSGDSSMVIDVTKDNLYWIDAQWLGAGRVRFGVYYDGARVVCHEYYHGNTQPYSVSATGSLPACFSQRNIGATGSSSEMRIFCSAVWTESNIDTVSHGEPGQRSIDCTIPAANDVYRYLGTMAPIEKYSNGRVNRSLYYPSDLNIMAFDTVTGNPVKVEVEIRVGSALSGLEFIPTNNINSTVEYDVGEFRTGTPGTSQYFGGGFAIYKAFIDGTSDLDLTSIYNNMTTGAVKNYAERGGHRMGMIANITNASTAVVTFMESENVFRETIAANVDGVDRDNIYVYIDDVGGMTQINSMSTKYYLKLTGLNTAEIYTNPQLTTPLNTTTFGTYTSGGHAHGFYGTQFYWSLVAKKYFGTNPARIIAKVGWKEIRQ